MKKANVILCTDKKQNFPYITNITFDEVESDLTRAVKNINYFKNEKIHYGLRLYFVFLFE